MSKYVAVVGSRKFSNYNYLREKLDGILETTGTFTLVSGGAPGADTLAYRWARERHLPVIVYSADWSNLSHPDAKIKVSPTGRKYDAMAGFRRNTMIVDKADLVVAFWDGISPGTKDTIDKTRAKEKLLIVYPLNPR